MMNCMKVLTIKQPYASAVVYGYKEFEFRSWKTNYRGKILIHAAMTKDSDSITKFEEYHLDYNFGMIIGEVDLLDCILVDDVLDKSLRKKDDIIYSYRHTSLKDEKCIVLSAVFSLEKGNMEESKELIKSRYLRRVETQPLDKPSAGSVFRNPIDEPAGKIIEDLGFKGTCCNGAKVSEKHANFIVNSGNATSEDVISLINDIKKCVKEKKNIDLVLEQEIVSWE